MNSGGGWVTPGTVRTSNGGKQTLAEFINLKVQNLIVGGNFTFQDKGVSWRQFEYVTNVEGNGSGYIYIQKKKMYTLSTAGYISVSAQR